VSLYLSFISLYLSQAERPKRERSDRRSDRASSLESARYMLTTTHRTASILRLVSTLLYDPVTATVLNVARCLLIPSRNLSRQLEVVHLPSLLNSANPGCRGSAQAESIDPLDLN
jgi:hypothetical protein